MGSTLFSTTGNPVIIGHRGAAGYAPANSLEALRKAATGDGPARSDAVEIDLRVTSDGELVVIHDAHLTDGSEVVALPASRVRAISTRLGEPVSTLIEALDAAPGVVICVEVKALPPGRDDALLQALESVPRARRHIHAFDHRIIARLRAAATDLSLGVLSTSYPIDPTGPIMAAGADTLWQEASLIDAELAARCHDRGIALVAWTVNDNGEARRLAALGVDALCGDWPDRLRIAP